MIHTGGESFDVRDGAAAIAIEPDSAVVTIPDAHFLFTADFKRKGPDLVLTGEDGRKMLVPDYFRQEKHPDLASPEGALLSASMVELLSGSAAPGQYAQAGAPAAQQPVGRVETVTGSAQVVRNGVAIELNVGDLVFQGDVAQTRTNSTLAIAFSDGSAFTLNENARMALNEFVYDPNSTTNSAVINLVQGTVSFIAAQVAKTGNMRVETPTATLGIRGTFITVSVSSTDGNTVASLGLETNQTTGEQYSGVFTLTNKISGNQVTVSQVASMFSVSPAGMISELPKPAGIAALESATFQALIPVMNAAASFGATTGTQNLNQNINQNAPPAQNAPQDSQKGGNQGPSNSPSSGPASGGSSGPSQTYDSKSPVDNSKTVSLSSQPTGDPTPVNTPPANTPPVNTPPANTPPVNTPPANTPPANPTPPDTTPHVTPTATVTNVTDIETASVRAASFNIGAHVSIANAGTPTGYVSGSATLVSATVPGGLPSTLTDAAFLSSLLMIDPDGTVRYDSSKFAFLADGQSLSYTIAFDLKSGTDILHLTLTFTVTGANEAPTITVRPGDTAAVRITDDTQSTTLHAQGTLSFADVDVADGHSLSVAVKSGPAIGSFVAGIIADTTGGDSTVPSMAGDIGWVFVADKAHLQSLAAGETETEVFTITLSDGHGGTTSEDVTVTVVGVNDAPTITAASTVPTGAFSELTSKTNDTADKDQASGTIAFADPDLTDHHLVTQALPTFTWSAGTLTAAQKAALTQASTLTLVEADSTGTGFGSVAWKYQITDSALDFLAAGEKLTVTYNVTVDDGHGGTVTQPLTVTITGTNDDANISVGSGDHDARAVTEDAHESATETTSGTLSFSDVDLTDHHSVTGVTASSGALGTLTASVTHDTSGTGTGGVLTWNYSVADSAIDYLAAGQTKVETFTVSLFDGTSTVTKDVTVTITGTNDAPVAVADIAAATEDALPNTVNGNVLANDTDVDNGDTHTVSALIGGTDDGTTITKVGIYGTLVITKATGGYTYTLANGQANVQALADGQHVTDVFTYTNSDNHGGSSQSTLTVTITGTNDDANISVGSGDHDAGAVTEDAHESATETTSGTLSFSDVDLTDHHSVTGVTASSGALGTLTASVTHDTSGTGTGGVLTWNYSVADSAIDYLAAGQTKVETFTVSLFDGTSTVTKDVTVTITGTNDNANISVGSGDHDARAVTEDAHESGTETTSGTLSFSDVDLTDHHSVTGVTASSGALGTLTASVTHDTSGTGTGGVLTWNYSVADSAIDYLAAGQTKVETFTVSLFDGTSTVTKDVTVTITGTNDAPVITGGPITASVQEDGTTRATGQLTATDPDLTDTQTWSIVGASPTHAPNYQFKIDEFKIVKNGGVFFDDTFSDNNPPPSAPTGFGSITSYSVTGTVLEQDGKAILTGSNTGFGTGSPSGDPFFGEYATLNTNTDPTNTSLGLKANSSFTVSGAFDLTLPAEDRNAYGIRLTDRTSSQAGDSTVELRVARGADGIERVQLREIDFSSHTTTVLQSFTLSPGSHDQILLSLTNDAENTGVIHASFELEQGGLLDSSTLTNFTATGTIFNNENWTRAQFFAEAPQQSDSVLQGTYGQLDITQSGAWTYQLANGQANVQALAAGQTVQDIFTAQVADGHGGFDTKTITVNVTGTNDAPVAVADVAAVTEDANTPSQPNPVSGNVLTNDTDVDIGDTHTVTKVNGSSGNVGHDVAGTYGTLHLNADGSYTYTLANGQANVQALADGQHVTDVFTYTNSDNHGGSSQSTLTVTVNGTNDAPVAVADVAAVTEDALPNTVNGNVLANDTDVDNGDTHTVSAVSGGTDNGTTITKVGIYGTLVITKATGGYTYTLANGQANVQALADGQHVTDVFTYTNSDNHGGSNQSTLTVTITGTNDAPTIAAGTTATGHIVAVPHDTAAPLTPLAASYLTAGHDLVNGLGGPSGFGESDVARGDDNSSQAIDIRPIFGAAGLNFFGHSYTSLYINNNGNITFGSPTSQFTPSVIAGGANNPIIAPFWADVDTRGGLASPTPGGHSTGANLVHYDLDSANGVMTITWDDVGYYSGHTNPLDAFQLQLISVGNGNFDIVFRYEDINWTTGDASGGSGGLGGQPARAGYSAGDGIHYFELSQSGNQAQMLALEGTTGNTGIAGVDVFEVRNGNVVSNLTSSGTILFSDADLADSHSVGVSLSSAVWSGGGDIPATTQAVLAHALTTSMTGSTGHDSTGTGSGAIGWVFNLPRGDADFLAQDETLTVIYDVTIDDHHGGTVTQSVTVTITGAAQETDWNAATNGNWENAANWNHGVPSSSIAAVIAVSGTYTVSVSSNTAQADSLTVDNSHATLAADTGHSLTITGTLTVDAGNISLTGGTIQAGSIDLEGAATLVGFGAVSGSITNSGVIEAQSSHTLDISGNISGTGSIEVLNHATLEVAGSVASTQTLSFAGGTGATGTLVLDHSLTQPFSAVISGLGQNDNIDLKDLTFTSSGDMHATTLFANGYTTLEVTKISTNQSVTFTLSGDYTHSTWIFAQDSGTGTIFHDPPAADAGATNVAAAGSTSGDLTSTVTAALALQGGADDQFTFQAAQPDTLASATQNDATSQTALASPAAIGPDGSDTFVFSANFGHETIANFHPDIDVIAFDHSVFADFQAVLAAAHDDGQGNAVIAANSHDSVTIKNVTVTQLAQHQGDFHFT